MDSFVSEELYERFKERVLEMSPAIQIYEGTRAVRDGCNLTDQEIAHRLGLEVSQVQEIRCIAEVDLIPEEAWLTATYWKTGRRRAAPSKDRLAPGM